MFTGIVLSGGQILNLIPQNGGLRAVFTHPDLIQGLSIGDSVAVNGCCLTVTSLEGEQFTVDMVPETLARTNLGNLSIGDKVNMERPLQAGGRFDGHFVQGHVDGIGTLRARQALADGSFLVQIEAEGSLTHYMVEKGSIAVDGVSLTLCDVEDWGFSFAMIPHTAELTTLGWKQPGAPVNLEVDILAKYAMKAASAARV